MRIRSIARRIALVALGVCAFAPTTASGVIVWDVSVILTWTYPPVSPCYYEFWGDHETIITSYNSGEGEQVVVTQGAILRYNAPWNEDIRIGKVKHGIISADTHVLAWCPLDAQAKWRANTNGRIGSLVKVRASELVIGYCPDVDPDPEFGKAYQATKILAVDLESGRVIQPDWHFEAPQGLTRTDVVDGKSYFQEEWVVIEVQGDMPAQVLGASSSQALRQVDEYMSALESTHGFRVGAPYLVIEAARHSHHRFEPLIRFVRPSSGDSMARSLADGRVTLRAQFSPHGEIEDVRAIEGTEQAAWALAKDLRVEFPVAHEKGSADHMGNRAVVFATFELERGKVRFVSGVPTLLP